MFWDHGILRSVWRNFSAVAPGVYRANQPSPETMVRYMRRGIRSVVNLRGSFDAPPYHLERDAAQRLGITQVDVNGLTARAAPPRGALLDALAALRAAEKPVLMHCKSGADRTSLVAAIYLLAECGAPLAEARRQFSPRFIHFRWTRTGVLDHILDQYEAAGATPGFEAWLREEYDAAAVQASFDAARGQARR